MNREVSLTNEYSEASPKVAVIFPTKNEENTIESVISVASKSNFNPDIMVVDAYSSDKTVELAVKAGATVVRQPEQIFPGKGIAMKAGLREVISNNTTNNSTTTPADIILFLDLDIKNLTADWVDKLVMALLEDSCDMTRGFYQRQSRDAAVTKLIARPMLNIFFPEVSHFEQPLSGEVCARRQVWETLLRTKGSPDGWGIDVWFLIESAIHGYNIKEVFMGRKEHTSFEQTKKM
jgi:glucosyl-3-phosphoglycerate synthase